MSIIKEMNNIRRTYGSSLFSGGLTFAANSACYMLHLQPLRGPIYAGFDVTFRCNCRCKYCDRWKEGRKGITELNTRQALKIVDELGRAGTWMISFNGGEPLLRPDIFELIKKAKKRGMIVDINTNGWLLKRAAKKLINSGVDTITVSVESEKSKYHDEIRQTKNLFKKLNEGIEEVKKLRGDDKAPIIKVRAALSKDNIEKIHKYINHWEPLVDEVILQPIHECTKNFFVAPKNMKFHKDDKKKFITLWNKLRKKYSWLNTAFYSQFPIFFFGKKALHKKYTCFAGTFYVQIDPYGNLFSCNEYTFKMGNIKSLPFKKIWRGARAKKIRDILRKQKQRCVCWYNCNGTLNCYLTKTIGLGGKGTKKTDKRK